MTRFFIHYFTALAALSLGATAYQTAADTFLRPMAVTAVAPRTPTEKPTLKSSLTDLFSEDSWQLGDCKRILTSNGALLFKNWHQTSEGHWKLEPVTIVIGRGLSDNPSDAPVVLVAPDGADVQFADTFDVMGGSAPPIKRGRLIGDVRIDRPSATNARNRLTVRTRNLHIDNEKVWSTEDIKMEVGGAQMRGRDLTIFLSASATTATTAESPSSILDRMELVYLEEMRVDLRETDWSEEQVSHVSVLCDGKLTYDFALDQLLLRNNVNIRRSAGERLLDSFHCDTVDLVLRDPEDRSIERSGPLDWVDRVRAEGTPASVSLAEQDIELHAEIIDFDAIGGLLTATGSEAGIHIRRGPIDARLARLDYQYDPSVPGQIGTIDALGAGLVTVTDPALPVRQVRWNEGFRLQPLDRTTIEAVQEKRAGGRMGLRIDGDVKAKLSDGGTFRSDSIEGYLRLVREVRSAGFHVTSTPNPIFVKADPSSGQPSPLAPADATPIMQPVSRVDTPRLTMVPEEFHATGKVSLLSSLADVTAEQLSLEFKRVSEHSLSPKAPDESAENAAGVVQQPENGSKLRAPVARSKPKIGGDLIAAQILLSESRAEVKDLSVKGSVNVEHHFDANGMLMPVNMTGETMRLIRNSVSQGSGSDRLQLGSGPDAPAFFKVDDGFFVGPMINIWPSESIVHVTGAGECKVPTKLLESQPNDQGEATQIRWARTPHCRWNGMMEFDGQTAELSGGVRIDSAFSDGKEPWLTSMTGDKMHIRLSQRIDLSKQKDYSRASVSQIDLVQLGPVPVTVETEHHDNANQLQARHIITARRLVMDPRRGGEIVGAGPGWYRGWMLSDPDRSIFSTDAPPKPTQSIPPTADESILQGIHLTFREAMHADVANKELTFHGGVRSGAKRVYRWDEIVDVAQMERLAIDEATLNCMKLQFGLTPGFPADLRSIPGMPVPWEMKATGGVILRSRREQGLYEATAASASYDSRKSMLVVEGAGNQNAIFRLTNPQGKVMFNMPFPRLALNPRTMEGEARIDGATVGNLPVTNRK